MIIEDAYDEFHTVVKDSLETYLAGSPLFELADNLVIENNADKELKSGYCIQFAGDENTNVDLSGLTGMDQTVFVTLTIANFGTIRDISKRKDAEKKLKARKDIIVKAIAKDPQLNDKVARCIYAGSEAIELIYDAENEKVYLMQRSTYTIGYFEQCST
jgi:hypothetical protein